MCQLKLTLYCLIRRFVKFWVKLWYYPKIILEIKFRIQHSVADLIQILSVTALAATKASMRLIC